MRVRHAHSYASLLAGKSRKTITKMACSPRHDLLSDVGNSAFTPILEIGTHNPLIESAERRPAMNLVVDLLVRAAAQRQPIGVNKVPTKDESHFLLWVDFRGVEHGLIRFSIIGSGLCPHILETFLE